MAYTSNVPQPNQTIASSQTPILDNFIRINDANNVNHTNFNAANFGKHKNIQMPNFTTNPSPGTAIDETGLFTKIVGAVPRLFFQQANEGVALPGFQISGETPDLTVASGHTYLPGGIEVKFGLTAVGALTTVVPYSGTGFASVITAFTSIVFGGAASNLRSINVDISNPAQITIYVTANVVGAQVGWCVLGTI